MCYNILNCVSFSFLHPPSDIHAQSSLKFRKDCVGVLNIRFIVWRVSKWPKGLESWLSKNEPLLFFQRTKFRLLPHIFPLRVACTSRSRESVSLLWALQAPTHVVYNAHTWTCSQKHDDIQIQKHPQTHKQN